MATKNSKKTKRPTRAKSRSNSNDSFNLVRSIADGNNVKAYKILEKALRERVSKKIDDALANG